jgi:hypothetical protein
VNVVGWVQGRGSDFWSWEGHPVPSSGVRESEFTARRQSVQRTIIFALEVLQRWHEGRHDYTQLLLRGSRVQQHH